MGRTRVYLIVLFSYIVAVATGVHGTPQPEDSLDDLPNAKCGSIPGGYTTILTEPEPKLSEISPTDLSTISDLTVAISSDTLSTLTSFLHMHTLPNLTFLHIFNDAKTPFTIAHLPPLVSAINAHPKVEHLEIGMMAGRGLNDWNVTEALPVFARFQNLKSLSLIVQNKDTEMEWHRGEQEECQRVLGRLELEEVMPGTVVHMTPAGWWHFSPWG